MGRCSVMSSCLRAHYRLVMAGIAALLYAMPLSAYALDANLLWTSDAHMIMEGSPMAVDLDGDGDDEIVTAAYENLIAFDGTGKELWRFDTKGRYSTCPAIFERSNTTPLLFAGDNKGQFTCLDGAGNVIWQAETGPVFCASPALAYLKDDGSPQVIQGDQNGTVHVFDGLTGKPIWKQKLEGQCSSVAVGDKNNDGNLDVVVATATGKVYALDAAGTVVWRYDLKAMTQDWATCSPILFGNSKGQTRVLCASSQPRVVCIDSAGAVAWDFITRGAIASTLSAGDFDQDGRADLFAVTQLGILYRFDEDGRMLWEIDTQGRSLAPGAIVDFDGDGLLDYVLSTQNGNLLVFGPSGEMMLNYQFNSRTINMTPAFGDFVKDRPGIELAATGGESGRAYCFSTPAQRGAAAQWRTYRGDNHLTGAWFGLRADAASSMVPENLASDAVLTTDTIRFRIDTPKHVDGILVAEASCTGPDGVHRAALSKVVGGSGALQLPLTISAPGTHQFAWSLRDAAGARIAAGARALDLQPLTNDRALAARAIAALREICGTTSPASTESGVMAALHREAAAIESEVQAIAGLPANDANALLSRTELLSTRATRALAIARAAKAVLDTKAPSPVLVFDGTTWENQDLDRQLPEPGAGVLKVTRRCVPGEHEPVSLKLFNPTADTVAITCSIETPLNGVVATPYEVKAVPTNLGLTAWDPIVPIRDGRLEIPSLQTREIWLDIDAVNTKTGSYAIDVAFNGNPGAHIALEVLPFQMAGFESMRLCCWGQYNAETCADLLAHGNTVFVGSLPPVTVDAGAVKVDYAPLDTFIAPLKGADVYLLLNGIPALGPDVESDAYVPLFADYLKQVFAHLAEHGIDDQHIALYPYDEPGGNGWDVVKRFVAFGKQARKARPSINIYMDGGGDLPMYEQMAEVTTVWSPSFYMLPEQSPEMAVVRKSGKTLWSYDCGYGFSRPVGWNTKTINIVAQYRLAAIIGMHFGATGIGYWCYNHGESMWGPVVAEFPLVYSNPDGTVTGCRRWEAVREGMEDARILLALRSKLTDASVAPETQARITALLKNTVAALSTQTMEESRLGVARYVLDATNNDATVARLRAEMMDCVALLAK